MGFLVGIIAFLAGICIFTSNLGSIFIGLPFAIKAKAKNATKMYAFNTLFGVLMIILVIVLTSTVLSEYVLSIVLGYFVIPFVFFIISSGGYAKEAKDEIAREKLAEMGVSVDDVDLLKKNMIDEIIEMLCSVGTSEEILCNIKLAYDNHDKYILMPNSITILKKIGFTDDDLSNMFNK